MDSRYSSQIISKQNDDLFLCPPSLTDEPHCPWTIALTTAADALFVYRLLIEKDFSAISLGYVLIDEGICFRTLQPLSSASVPSSIKAVHTVIPIHVQDYTFNVSNYHSYVQERARLLSSPQGRAALLEGGLVDKNCKNHAYADLNHITVTLGSSAVTVHCQGFSFTDKVGIIYWDDKLMDDEILTIWGLYHCYTGNGSQMADVSWWPTPVHWDNPNANALNWGHWTEWDEVWYQQRVKDILTGQKTGVPITQCNWRSKLKGSKVWKQVTQHVRDKSKSVRGHPIPTQASTLESYIPPFQQPLTFCPTLLLSLVYSKTL
ncbi:hypothetical protein BYT27DRAFT_7078749 [Phlegmacium glaucopus]|nr:hypothetical protein BYT27DRAFT_7078749 [Phlegmacium glaucopus]